MRMPTAHQGLSAGLAPVCVQSPGQGQLRLPLDQPRLPVRGAASWHVQVQPWTALVRVRGDALNEGQSPKQLTEPSVEGPWSLVIGVAAACRGCRLIKTDKAPAVSTDRPPPVRRRIRFGPVDAVAGAVFTVHGRLPGRGSS